MLLSIHEQLENMLKCGGKYITVVGIVECLLPAVTALENIDS